MFLKISPNCIAETLTKMGVHPVGVEIMAPKGEICPLKLTNVRAPGANIIKQEMLALNGECATPAGAINCSVDRLDIVLLGTTRQYAFLREKLRPMAHWFDLKSVIADLEQFLASQRTLETALANGKVLTYDRVKVMGILNVTSDSFYAGSRVESEGDLLKKAEYMLKSGADILDLGAESTRPGAKEVTPEEEEQAITSAVLALKKAFPDSVLSIDTYRSTTARAALEVGADILNDISAGLRDPKMLGVAKEYMVPIILMHMRGTPQNMQSAENTTYVNVVDEVAEHLFVRGEAAKEAGLTDKQIILDPGIGFAKTVEGNLSLLKNLSTLTNHGYPILLAASRKSTIGKVLGDVPPEERLEGTLATTAQAFYSGCNMVRVHDVLEHKRLLTMLEAINK